MPANRAYEAGAIPTHALLQQRLPERRKARPEEEQSVTWNAEESEGESCFLLRRMSAGIGQGVVGFLAFD
jgi:hypothetical protein